MKKIYLLFSLLFLSIASVNAQTGIRQVDFKNFTYEPYCVGEDTTKVTVADGEFYEQKEVDGFPDRFAFNVFGIAYGDLNGDKQDEAVVLTVCNTGGTGNFTEGFIFGMKADAPILLARIPGGDRAYGGLREARIEKGLLVIESNDVGDAGGACCPEFVVTSRYKLSGNKLITGGKSERRELYPKQRVSFPKGKSGTTMKVTVSAQELKRLVVGARAGQTLIVSMNTKNGSLRLIEEAAVTDETTKLTAKLPKSGDYTIEIQNFEATDQEITITIQIK